MDENSGAGARSSDSARALSRNPGFEALCAERVALERNFARSPRLTLMFVNDFKELTGNGC
jgi:hypothetical protein